MSGKGGKRAKSPSSIPAPVAVSAPVARRWLWWRSEAGARPKAKEEFEGLPTQGRAGLAVRIDRYLKGETRFKDVDSLGDGLLELRYRFGNNHFRVLFILWGPHCVALIAFYKNQQSTPKADLDRARKRADSWRKVFGDEPQD